MIAGRGIVHSERSAPERRKAEQSLHGIQAWVALPQASEQTEPAFFHHPSASLPELSLPGITLRLIAGDGFGLHSPVETASPTLYADVQLTAAAELALPTDHVERAFYVVSGQVACAGDVFGSGDLVILKPGAAVSLRAEEGARVMVLGGAPIDGERHIFWNFVSSSSERLERAKQDWKERRFPLVPGDEVEFTPLPPG
jgi:redox-sensitive bicupin YhaK (pirin superfamily)